jgi:hypothetical protein
MFRYLVRYAICAAIAALQPLAAFAQENPQEPCSSPAYRQLDFWVGTWDLSWINSDGSTGRGTNIITKDEYGPCVIHEHFSAPQMQGMSVSTFHAPTGVWRQTWVDDTGGYFALVGGPVRDGSAAFELRNTRLSTSEPHLRMVWEDVSESALTWRWQMLPANADPDSGTWNDSWVIRYERRN